MARSTEPSPMEERMLSRLDRTEPLIELDPEKMMAESDFSAIRNTGVTLANLRAELAELVEAPLFKLVMSLLITLDALFITLEAMIGYRLFGPPAKLELLSHALQGGSRFILSVLVIDVLCLLMVYGIRLFTMLSYVLYCGVIGVLLYFELAQCWLGGACDWVGLLICLRIPYALYNAGTYWEYFQDLNHRPGWYLQRVRFYLDHPLVHVYVVGLTLIVSGMFVAFVLLEFGPDSLWETWLDEPSAAEALYQVRSDIYWLFLVDTLLHCYFIGLGELCTKPRLGLDAGVVLLCWGLQMSLEPAYSAWTSILMAARLHRLGRIAYVDWASGRGDELYAETIQQTSDVAMSRLNQGIEAVEGALNTEVPDVVQSGGEAGLEAVQGLLAVKFRLASVLLIIVEIAVFSVLIVMSYFDALEGKG